MKIKEKDIILDNHYEKEHSEKEGYYKVIINIPENYKIVGIDFNGDLLIRKIEK